MIAYVFPGQGSQVKGMGGDLFEEFGELTAKADKILGYSIRKLCMEDPEEQLGQTNFTQPALYVVNALTYLKKIKQLGKEPDYVAGHSLGEYNALLASGVFDFETGIKLVKKRGELMSQATEGGMAAVIGLSEEKVREVIDKNKLIDLDIANFNAPTQIVVSGPKKSVEQAQSIFEASGAMRYIVLKVSGAFHSRYMEDARKSFEEFMEQFEFLKMKTPVISNVYARPYRQKDLKSTLAIQITNSVKWTESIRYLMGKNVEEIVQVGPGNILTGLVKTIQREAQPLITDDEIEEDMEEEVIEKPVGCVYEEVSAVGREVSASKENKAAGSCCHITPESLGSSEFKSDYGIRYAYLTGAMYKGIASKEMIVSVGKAGMMGFFGTGGLDSAEIEEAIKYIQSELKNGEAYGMNLLHNPNRLDREERLVDMFLKHGVRRVEAAGFMSITPALVKYRLKGLTKDKAGRAEAKNRIIAKISRPEVAEAFLSPAPERIVNKLLLENKITKDEADLARLIPMADDLCAEADSGGHTDHGVAYALVPVIIKLRNNMMSKYCYNKNIRVGAAGGIGTPEAAAAAFVLGADFIMTGSVNQCTFESGTSNEVKDLLQEVNIQDTDYAPAGDMFEIGAKVQVLKRGVFFPARANRLYDLYRQYNSLDEIDSKTKKELEERYFKRSIDEVYEKVKARYSAEEIEKAERNPKHKMAMIFRWYFAYTNLLALNGDQSSRIDYQIHCGPSLGAFNQWVKGTNLESWKNRHVDEIGKMLMTEAAKYLNERFKALA
ncbi:MAG: ACP S-malonyltransferase [Clostridia bacterium]|nr:ACP S-malonyltransferase [Clostridia bacterium]